jgi:hypothetical protein
MPNRYALLVGIDLYINDGSRKSLNGQELVIGNLHGCVNDVESIREILQDKYEFNSVSALTSSLSDTDNIDTTGPVKSPKRLPTFSNIKREFGAVTNCATSGDFFLFYYSGHGAQLQRVSESPEGCLKDPSLLTFDFGYGFPAVRGWQLNLWLEQLNVKGVRVAVVLDSCHTDGSLREKDVLYRTPIVWTELPNLPIDEYVASEEGIEPTSCDMERETSWSINSENLTLIVACKDNEMAAEITIDGEPVGVFTYKLLGYLRENDTPVTYRMIQEYLSGGLKGQSPTIYGRDMLYFLEHSKDRFTLPDWFLASNVQTAEDFDNNFQPPCEIIFSDKHEILTENVGGDGGRFSKAIIGGLFQDVNKNS